MLNETSTNDPVIYDAWHVVALSDDVKCNQLMQVHLLGKAIALWRTDTEIIACQDRYPHRGVSLAQEWIDDQGAIVCPYHAMSFNTVGRCTRIPADPRVISFPQSTNLQIYKVQEKYGFVWVALGEPIQGLPVFPEWEQAEAMTFQCGPYFINTSAPRIVENFVDVAHFPFTHKGLLGDPEFPEVSDYKLVVDSEAISASDGVAE